MRKVHGKKKLVISIVHCLTNILSRTSKFFCSTKGGTKHCKSSSAQQKGSQKAETSHLLYCKELLIKHLQKYFSISVHIKSAQEKRKPVLCKSGEPCQSQVHWSHQFGLWASLSFNKYQQHPSSQVLACSKSTLGTHPSQTGEKFLTIRTGFVQAQNQINLKPLITYASCRLGGSYRVKFPYSFVPSGGPGGTYIVSSNSGHLPNSMIL